MNGFCVDDTTPGIVRVYPDRLAPRFYLKLPKAGARVIVWSESDLRTAGITIASREIGNNSAAEPYCSVGLRYGTPIQVVKIWNTTMGSDLTKSFVTQTPATLRARQADVISAARQYANLKKPDKPNKPDKPKPDKPNKPDKPTPTSTPDPGEPADQPTEITSSY